MTQTMTEQKTQRSSNRIAEIDILRGIAVFLMIFDHMMFDIFGLMPSVFADFPRAGFSAALCRAAQSYWSWDVRIVLRYAVVFVFLSVTGICCSFSRSNLKRGCRLMLVALALTAVTLGVGILVDDIDMMVAFGVLHCIALTLIIIGLLEKLGTGKWVYLALGVLMLIIGIMLESESRFVSFEQGDIPMTVLRAVLGFVSCGSDSFPLPLNGGQIFIGVFLGKHLYSQRRSLIKNAKYPENALTLVGRHSLAVYCAHQMIIPLIFGVILLLCGFSISI